MNRRRVLLFTAVLSLAANAGAQTAPPARPPPAADASGAAKAEARSRFERGLVLFNEGAFDAALAEFRRSRELYPTRGALQNAALAMRKLARYDEALDALEQVVKEYPNLPEADRQGVDRELTEVRMLVGAIQVQSSEPDSMVLIDGKERGHTPLAAARVAAGSHLVRVYKEGFLPFETRAAVAGRQTVSVDARLGALTKGGRLAVTEERGTVVRVVVDGVTVGNTPWEGTLPIGPHTVVLRGEGDVGSPPASVDVRLNQLSKLALVAEPLPCPLRIDPTPVSARVAVDGVDVGQGVWQGALRCGGHVVEIAAEGFLPVSRSTSLAQGKPGVVKETLERDPSSSLWRAANPPRVTLDARAALLLGPSLGGDLADACTGPCSRGVALGALVMLRLGYQLGSGLGFAVDAGFMSVAQTFRDRPATITPLGLPAHTGLAHDVVHVSGPTLGASVALQRGDAVVWMGRLGAGAVLGAWSDSRRGTFTTDPPSAGVTYAPPELKETGGLRALYVNPELRLGYRFSTHWIADAGVEGLVLVSLSDATWSDATEVAAGRCPNADPVQCAGRGGYGKSQVVGKTMFLMGIPMLGIRYEL